MSRLREEGGEAEVSRLREEGGEAELRKSRLRPQAKTPDYNKMTRSCRSTQVEVDDCH